MTFLQHLNPDRHGRRRAALAAALTLAVAAASATVLAASPTQPISADLRVSMVPAVHEVRPGERLTHTISLANVSNREAQAVVVTASLAAGTTWVADDGTAGGFTREQLPGAVRWRRPAVAGPSTHFLELVTRVPQGAVPGSQVVHQVAVGAATFDDQPQNNSAQAAPVRVVVPDLWLAKTGPAEAGVGTDVEYTLRLGNRGVGAAPAVVITDVLPLGLSFLGSTPSPAAQSGQRLVWRLGRLPAGGEELVRVRVRVSPARLPGEQVINVADAVPGSQDANPADNRSQAATRVVAGPAAAVSITLPAALPVSEAPRPLSVTVRDAGGNPVADGTRVTLSTTRGTLGSTTPNTLAGVAATTFTPGRQPGAAVLRAVSGSVAVTRSLAIQPGPPAAILVRTGLANPSVDDGVGLTVTVNDRFGNAVSDGSPVNFASSLGAVAPSPAGTQAGVAAARWSSRLAAHGLVTATAGTVWGAAGVTFRPGRAASVDLKVGATELAVNEGVTSLLATVADQFGNAVAEGVDVRFDVGGGTAAPATARTAAGVAQSTYRAGPQPGVFGVGAAAGLLSAAKQVELRPADLTYAEAELRGPRGRARDTQTHPGEELTYALEVHNGDLATARGVVVGVSLPDTWLAHEVQAAGGIGEEPEVPPGLLQPATPGRVQRAWRLPDLARGASARVVLRGPVTRDHSWTGRDSLFVQTAVTTTTAVARPEAMRRSDTAGVYAADLYVSVSLDSLASQLVPGGRAVYDITFGNRQPLTDVGTVRITNTVPAGMTFDHWQPTPGTDIVPVARFDAASRELVWEPRPPYGLAAGLRVWLAIDPDVPPTARFENRVRIGSRVQDVAPADNVATDGGVALRGVNLMAGVDGPAAAHAGQALTYNVVVRNTSGQDVARNVVVDSYPPAGAELIASDPPGRVEPAAGRVRWQMESLSASGEAHFRVQVRVPESAVLGSLLRHRVEVTSDETDRYLLDNSAAMHTRVVPGPAAAVVLRSQRPAVLTCGTEARETTILAELRDARGNLVVDGTPVQWTTAGGRLAVETSATLAGLAPAAFHGEGQPGVARITARSGAAAGELDLELLPGLPAVIDLEAGASRVSTGSLVDLWSRVHDGCGHGVADGTPVRFAAARGTFVGGGTTVQAPTLNGRATARLAVGNGIGPLAVEAGHDALTAGVRLEVVAATPTPLPPGRRLHLPFVQQRLLSR